MPDYRRNYLSGATYFFTLVTHERRPILTTELGRKCLREVIEIERVKRPFEIIAIVLLPDYMHLVTRLPQVDSNFSIRWARIKSKFSRLFLDAGGQEGSMSSSRITHKERAIWQRRFWEHTCRSDEDVKRCVDYLHWNPVKHGLVASVGEYQWSSFHRFVREGEYDRDWGQEVSPPVQIDRGWE